MKRKARSTRPYWDFQQRALLLGRTVVKRLLRRAANQELLLMAFQEQHWRKRVDNPLGGYPRRAHERLRDAIKKLNRGQDVIRFHADGTGEGIYWELVEKQK